MKRRAQTLGALYGGLIGIRPCSCWLTKPSQKPLILKLPGGRYILGLAYFFGRRFLCTRLDFGFLPPLAHIGEPFGVTEA